MTKAKTVAKQPNSKGRRTGRAPTVKDAPAQKKLSSFDTLRLMVIRNPSVTVEEVKTKLSDLGKHLADSSITSGVFDMKHVLRLIESQK